MAREEELKSTLAVANARGYVELLPLISCDEISKFVPGSNRTRRSRPPTLQAEWVVDPSTGEIYSTVFEEFGGEVCLTTGWPFLQVGAFDTSATGDAAGAAIILINSLSLKLNNSMCEEENYGKVEYAIEQNQEYISLYTHWLLSICNLSAFCGGLISGAYIFISHYKKYRAIVNEEKALKKNN